LVHKLEGSMNRQFALHQQHLTDHDRKIEELMAAIESLRLDIKEIKNAGVPSGNSSRDDLGPGWLRKPCKSLFKVRSDDLITAQSCLDAIGPWIASLGHRYQDSWTFEGDWAQCSKDFVVHFLGPSAEQNCESTLRRQRRPGGVWETFFASTPSGSMCQLFLSPDKNDFQISKEIATKRMSTVLQTFSGVEGQDVFAARREGCVLVNWTPVCLVEPEGGGKFSLKWSQSALSRFAIDREIAVREFQRLGIEADTAKKRVGGIIASTQWLP
jgi:hypothetical protein